MRFLKQRVAYYYYRLRLSSVARQVQKRKLTYLGSDKLLSIQSRLRALKRARIPGDFVECGVALGGSAMLIASELDSGRCFLGYDVFGTIPPPDEKDDEKSIQRFETIKSGNAVGIDGGEYYGYMENLYEFVKDGFKSFGMPADDEKIFLKRGLFEDTLYFAPGDRVAFAHLDCDWYEPVKLSLSRIYPHLSPGGFMVLDDYNDYGGCREAADEFLADHSDLQLVTHSPHAIVLKS